MVLVSGGSTPSAGKSVWGSGFLPSVHQGVLHPALRLGLGHARHRAQRRERKRRLEVLFEELVLRGFCSELTGREGEPGEKRAG